MQFDCTLKREGEATHATRPAQSAREGREGGEKPESLAESECLQVLRNSDARVSFPLEKLAFSVPRARCTCGRLQEERGGSDALLGMDNTGKKRPPWQRAEGRGVPRKVKQLGFREPEKTGS